MTCGSVATVRGRVSEEHLARLITPAVAATVVKHYLEQQLTQPVTIISTSDSGCYLRAAEFAITVVNGEVEVNAPSTRLRQADELKRELVQLLTLTAGRLFQQQVRSILSLICGISDEQSYGDTLSLTTVTAPPMQIIVLPDGQLGVFIREGSFEAGKVAIGKLFADLRATGISIAQSAAVECHIADPMHDIVHDIGHQYDTMHEH